MLRDDVRAEGLEDLVAVEREEDPLVERREGGALGLLGGAIGDLRNFRKSPTLVGLLTLSSGTCYRLTAILHLNFTLYVIILTTFRHSLCVIQKNLENFVYRIGFLFLAEWQLIAVEVQRGCSSAKMFVKKHIVPIEAHAGVFEFIGPFRVVTFFRDFNIEHAEFVFKEAANFS